MESKIETKHTPEYILIYYKVRGAAIPNEMYPSQNDGYEYKDYREVIERTEDWERAYDNELIEDLQVLGFMPGNYSDLLKRVDEEETKRISAEVGLDMIVKENQHLKNKLKEADRVEESNYKKFTERRKELEKENQELKAELKLVQSAYSDSLTNNATLRDLNAELLEALEEAVFMIQGYQVQHGEGPSNKKKLELLKSAITKAKLGA